MFNFQRARALYFASERTSKLVALWSPNHDLEQNGNVHLNNLMKKKKGKQNPNQPLGLLNTGPDLLV